MGVSGITRFLQEQNILPSGSHVECCSTKLWKEWNPSMAFLQGSHNTPDLTLLPPNSKLLIDGNGLAFHLYHIAYARHIQETFASRRKKGACPTLKNLSDNDITLALPHMIPLERVREVTREFATNLRDQFDFQLECYWDGPAAQQQQDGGFKARTLHKRQVLRSQEWAALQTFCQHGTVPMKPSECICQCIWHFPLARLFTLTVKQALLPYAKMVLCQGEADVELARAGRGDPNAFVLGQDSDFIFYAGIQYVPFGRIYISSGANARVQVVCLTREKVAASLGLDDEDMVELAILLGNDYVDPKTLVIPEYVRDTKDKITYLQQHATDDFLVKSKNGNALELDFVRSLYNLNDDLDVYLQGSNHASSESESLVEEEEDMDDIHVFKIPEGFPLELASPELSDTSIRDVVSRCLQSFADICEGDEGQRPLTIHQSHVDAYQQVSATTNFTPSSPSTKSFDLQKRPQWDDICVARLVDLCISRALRANPASFFLTTKTPPHTLMNHIRFHQILGDSQVVEEEEESADIPNEEPEFVERPVLPIDAHQEKILSNVQQNRVTIIHGETGCGKSSRVPVMILEAPSPEPSLPRVKMFISQPRRIAAASLVNRVRSCEPDHREKFALRMGHGVREFESNKTQAWFVTTGYLTRLLANHPERFNDVTHLIVDEVHERSVDTDILCLLCRRLLESNKKIRLVLMSATLATKLYKDYFQVPSDPIHVGVRRFPIMEYFVEDLMNFKLPMMEIAAAKAIQKECETKRCNSAPSASELTKRFSLAARLTTIVGVPGSSVLIFVPGMGEILAITEAIEKFYRPGINYLCYPIHSDVPFEEQMEAFNKPGLDEVKVIIATNAAESSVTLPAVDHVICLGLCRQIMYNQQSHRQMLAPCWISKASATQRAGRTGRLAPGNVYRLYTRHAYEQYMDEFEQGEMVRIPLDSVILMLKEMLHEEARPVLMSCIEPPSMETIDKSFESLYHWSFLSEPNDTADITSLGSFVSALGVDLMLGFFIGLGIQFGVGAEAIEMAAVMSFPKSPFQISNPLIHDAEKYNMTTSDTYVARCHFDANLYSEPLALMNAVWDYHVAGDRNRWCTFYRFAHARMRQLHSTRDSLRTRVATFLGIHESRLQVPTPPVHMPHSKLTILRVLKVWVFSDSILESTQPKINKTLNDEIILTVPKRQKGSDAMTEERLNEILVVDRHPYRIMERQSISGSGTFETRDPFSLSLSIEDTLQNRFVSYMCAVDIDLAILRDDENTYVFLSEENAAKPCIHSILQGDALSDGYTQLLQAENDPTVKRRGILERKCGLWKVTSSSGQNIAALSLEERQDARFYRRIHVGHVENLPSILLQACENGEIKYMMSFDFSAKKKKKKKKANDSQHFSYSMNGRCQDILKGDLQDLLAAQTVDVLSMKSTSGKSIIFPPALNKPKVFRGKGSESMSTQFCTESSSWMRPVFPNIPEGARIISVLASGHRKATILKFPDEGAGEEDTTVDITLVPDEVNIGKRWRRIGADRCAYVTTETVPASAASCDFPLFACCSNTLEVSGGGMRAEGLTLLPPNPLFLLLCRLSFGLGPDVDMNFGSMAQLSSGTETGDKVLIAKAKHWLKQRISKTDNGTGDSSWYIDQSTCDPNQKILEALEFHKSCSSMGEDLVCFPKKVLALVELFKGVEGYDMAVDDLLEERSLTLANLAEWRKEAKRTVEISTKGVAGQVETSKFESSKTVDVDQAQRKEGRKYNLRPRKAAAQTIEEGQVNLKPPQKEKTPKILWRIVRSFDEATKKDVTALFATDLNENEKVESRSFPSTNILALLVQQFVMQVSSATTTDSSSLKPMQNYVALVPKNWEITRHETGNSNELYRAKYKNRALPATALTGRGKNKLPKWMKLRDCRPKSIDDAKACVPPIITMPQATLVNLSKDRTVLAFNSVQEALQMEAAFFLERQFAVASKSATRHWFQHTLDEMLRIMLKNESSATLEK